MFFDIFIFHLFSGPDCSSIGQSTALSRQKLGVRALSSESYDKTPYIIYRCSFSFSVYIILYSRIYALIFLRHKTRADDDALGITLPYSLSNLNSYDSGA